MDPKPEEEAVWKPFLPVPSVKEMVKENIHQHIPERYIRESNAEPQNISFCEATFDVPIINFSLLALGNEDERKRLNLACQEWGFFQMIVDEEAADVFEEMKSVAAAFFHEPLEVKMKYAMKGDADVQGFGQPFVFSEKQKLDWCDAFMLRLLPEKYKQLKHWPLVVPGFREAVERHSAEIYKLAEVVLANLSVLMKMEKDGLKKLQGEITQTMRMNYYPPCSRPDLVLGFSSHTDGGTLTFLLQDKISGLQILHNDDWIMVKPIPNAITVNIGDSLEVWSNGVYKSVRHRAVTNESAERISIATFIVPGTETEIGPIDTMVDNVSRPPMYKRIKFRDYFKQLSYIDGEKGKTNIELLKI